MKFLDGLSPIAHWILRLAIAGVFLYHGISKFPVAPGMAKMMGMPVIMVYMLALMETGAGILVLYGGIGPDWATRVAGLLVTPVMLGAIFMVHWGQWAFAPSETHPMGGMEFQVTLLLIALYLLVMGNGIKKGNIASS